LESNIFGRFGKFWVFPGSSLVEFQYMLSQSVVIRESAQAVYTSETLYIVSCSSLQFQAPQPHQVPTSIFLNSGAPCSVGTLAELRAGQSRTGPLFSSLQVDLCPALPAGLCFVCLLWESQW
jgi:hypothetical protein